MLHWVIGRFDFSQNEFEMRPAKKQLWQETFKYFKYGKSSLKSENLQYMPVYTNKLPTDS